MEKRASAVIIKDGKILLMRRIKNGQEYFVFPGGGVKEGETPEQALLREVKEELTLDVNKYQPLFEIDNQGRREFFFLVTDFSDEPKLGGEEKERMNKNNQYYPTYIDLYKITKLILYPESAKNKIIDGIKI